MSPDSCRPARVAPFVRIQTLEPSAFSGMSGIPGLPKSLDWHKVGDGTLQFENL